MKRHPLYDLADRIEDTYPGVHVDRIDIPDDVLAVGPDSLLLYVRETDEHGTFVASCSIDVRILNDDSLASLVSFQIHKLRQILAARHTLTDA
jgi:hypothetical protein